MKKNKCIQTGFTLIELLVVAAIVIVLTSIIAVNFRPTSQKARNSKREADISQIRSALELYRSTNSTYPVYTTSNHVTNFTNLIANAGFRTFLSTPSIVDPVNTTPYQYTYVSAANGFTYSVCYYVEPAGTQTCLTNP